MPGRGDSDGKVLCEEGPGTREEQARERVAVAEVRKERVPSDGVAQEAFQRVYHL